MKNTTYFGNRFKTALGGIRKRASRVAVVPASAPSSEFEALESRILLSGLTDGSRVLKNVTFTDADGDRVNIRLTGSSPAGAGFQIPNLGNGFDVDEINLVGGLTSANNLVITVTPVRQLATSNYTTGGSLWSPGYTNIGSIVSQDGTTTGGKAVTAATNVGSIGLNAAIVANIDLGGTNINGSISLGVGKTAFLDRINTANNNFTNAQGYNPVAGLIDLYDITADSIGRITVNGIVSSPTNSPFNGDTNDIVGNINIAGDLGGITAPRSAVTANISVGDDMGPIIVGKFSGNLAVGGDLTYTIPAGATGTVVAGGHINLAWAPATPGNPAAVPPIPAVGIGQTNITAGNGISGIFAATNDPILVPGALAPVAPAVAQGYNGTLTNIASAAIPTPLPIADITVNGGPAVFDVLSATGVGNITATSFGDFDVTAGSGGIKDIKATAGGIADTASFVSGAAIGIISTAGGINNGSFNAVTSIGNIVASNLSDAAIGANAVFTAGTNIGNISAILSTTAGLTGNAIADSADFNAPNGTIGNLSVTGNVGAATFDAISIGSITTTALAGGPGKGHFGGLVTMVGANGIATGAGQSVNIAGDLTGSLVTDNTGVLVGGKIGGVTIGGQLTGTIDANADVAAGATIGAILIGKGINGGDIASDGAITSITVSKGGIAGGANLESIGSITGALDVTGDVNNNVFTTVGGIGSVAIKADTTPGTGTPGDLTSTIRSASSIGAVEIAGTASGAIQSGQSAAGDIASVKVGAVNGLTIRAGLSATNIGSVVGAIEITGDRAAGQGLTVNAFPNAGLTAGGIIGAITANGITTDTATLTVTVGANARSVGAISVNNADAGEVANLSVGYGAATKTSGALSADGNVAITAAAALTNLGGLSAATATVPGIATLTTLGAVSVTGALSVTGNLAAITSAGAFSAGSMTAPGAGVQIGAGAASTITSIAIGADTAGGVGNRYEFRFSTIAGKTTASTGTDVVATVGPTNVAVFNVTNTTAGQSSTGGAIRVTLV